MPVRRIITAGAALAVLLASPVAHAAAPAPFSGDAPRPASCAKGDRPESGVQGEVTAADRASGRSAAAYDCNLSLVGHVQADGASWVDPTYGHCSYLARSTAGDVASADPGVKVVDVSDPAHPTVTATLTSPAMLGDTWESLKVNQTRGLLAGVSVPFYGGSVFFDVYDVKTDCAHPRLLDSVLGTALSIPANVMGHEGGWSPDGLTYWASGANAGSLTAVDVSDPAHPHPIYTGSTTVLDHGFDISPDGNRMYLSTTVPAGFVTLDISQVQARAAVPVVSTVSQATLPDSTAPQHTIAITQQGRPWIIAVDEIGTAGIHFVDMSDPANPVTHPGITLQIEQPANSATASQESSSDVAGIFGYSPHYCSVDRIVNPTALACGYFQAGVRVFDIRDLAHPREIAYYVPGGLGTTSAVPTSSYHADSHGDPAVDWCTSPPSFHGSELWVTCEDNGFLALRFAAGTFPLTSATSPTSPPRATRPSSNRPVPRRPAVTAPARSLAATGAPDWLAGLAVALVGGAALIAGARRRGQRRPPPGAVAVVVVCLAVTLAPPLLRGPSSPVSPAASADLDFARSMIAHHQQAIAMARAAEADPRTTAIDRTFAHGIAVQQGLEVRLLDRWSGGEKESSTVAAMTMGDARTVSALSATAYNRAFLVAMRAHHQAALPIIDAAVRDASPQVRVVAQTMLVDQTLEMRWIDGRLGSA